MIQLDSNMSQVSAHEDPEFFIDLIPTLDNRIHTLVEELKKPLAYIIPVDFQAHLQKAKNSEKIDQDWMENYKDIVALKVEGKINTTLMRLAEELRVQFGGQTIFWLDILCCFAQNQKYHQNLRIWQINDANKTCLHLQIGEYEKNRHFRRLAKHDIITSKKLISSINQLISARQVQDGSKKSTQELLIKAQISYRSHQQSSKKMVQFLRSEKDKCLQFFQQNNLLYVGKKSLTTDTSNSTSKKWLKEKERTNIPKQKMITDFSVQMMDGKNSQLLKKIVGKDERPADPQKINELDNLFYSMEKESPQTIQSIQNLRSQFRQSKSKLLSRPQSTFSNIFIVYSYIEYQDFPNPIESCHFKSFENPFQQNEQINYENNDYELFEEYEADRISQTDSEEDSDDNSLDSTEKRDFYNEQNDGYQMDAEDKFVQNTAFRSNRIFGGNQWVFNFSNNQPFWINKKLHEIMSKSNNEDSLPSPPQGSSCFILKEQQINEMINDFDRQTLVICPNSIPMQIAYQENIKIKIKNINAFPHLFDQEKNSDLTKEQQSKLKQIFHGKSKMQGMETIKASKELTQMFPHYKIRDFLSKMTKKRIKTTEGKFVFTYFINQDDNENHLKNKNIQTNSNAQSDDDSETDLDERDTALNDPEYNPKTKISFDSKSRSSSQRISNIKQRSMKNQQQPKSQSSSFSNQGASVTGSNSLSQKNKREVLRESKLCSQDTLTNPPISRLRPRSSKINQNLDKLLNGSQKEQKDVQI